MNLAFIVSSSIDTNQGKGKNFPYSLNRSCFTPEERLRQTQGTLNSLRLIDPDADIYLIDSSEAAADYGQALSYVPNLTFIDLNKLDYNVAEICRNNPSKGYCESSCFVSFIQNFRSTLEEYDFIVKITGRYFFSDFDKNSLSELNKHKYVIGSLRKYTWDSNWNYPEFLNDQGRLNWVPTWAYGVGKERFNDYYDGYYRILNFYDQNPDIAPYLDLECLFYEFIIKNHQTMPAPWTINGWNGVSGKFFTE